VAKCGAYSIFSNKAIDAYNMLFKYRLTLRLHFSGNKPAFCRSLTAPNLKRFSMQAALMCYDSGMKRRRLLEFKIFCNRTEIAEQLSSGTNTVRGHISHVLWKLDL